MNTTIKSFLEKGYERVPDRIFVDEYTYIAGPPSPYTEEETELGEALIDWMKKKCDMAEQGVWVTAEIHNFWDKLVTLPEEYTLHDAAEYVKNQSIA